ncbi:hypothetical protein [Methanobrevibacter curvatus]|nr:hypothetical protein [Methanobrevibacter curvatus]
MKQSFQTVTGYGRYRIHENNNPQYWAFVIMPIDIRIDSYHSFPYTFF